MSARSTVAHCETVTRWRHKIMDTQYTLNESGLLQTQSERDTQADAKRKARNARARANRRAHDDAMRSCGLVKVRGALGGAYWE